MFKLYKTNRDVQLQWMRENPGKTIAINVIGVAAILAYIAWYDRRWEKKWNQELAEQEPVSDSPSEN